MFNVCANYCGTTILLKSCETEDQAKEFMKHDYVLHYADEIEDGEEDEIIHIDEMFIENEVPFYEIKIQNTDLQNIFANNNELPF